MKCVNEIFFSQHIWDLLAQKLLTYWVILHAFLTSADFFFQNHIFPKIQE